MSSSLNIEGVVLAQIGSSDGVREDNMNVLDSTSTPIWLAWDYAILPWDTYAILPIRWQGAGLWT